MEQLSRRLHHINGHLERWPFLFAPLCVIACMALHRLVARLDTAEAAYIAGLVDGEGTVTLTRAHRNEQRRLVVCISNNEIAILRFVRSAVGAGKITSKRKYKAHHGASFTYQLSSRQALALLRQIVGYMNSYKAVRARLALDKYLPLTPRNGRYAVAQLAARSAFEAELLAIRL
jgi:LAGLIDADG DNA endonuclease family protein